MPGLEVAEIQVYDHAFMNRAPLGRASATSVRNNDALRYGPNIAINGNTSGWKTGELASTAQDDTKPCIEIDLGTSMALSRVTVFLRDKGSHPNPNSTWHEKSSTRERVEILNGDRERIWVRLIDTWRWKLDYSLNDIL